MVFGVVRMKDRIKQLAKISLLALMLINLSTLFSSGQVSVLTQHNDNARTGQNVNETTLNTSNVNVNGFGKLFWRTVDGFIYAQPLYVPGVTVQGATHNVVYVATQHNSVYAFDADNPNQPAPLWQVNLGTPVPSQDICIISGDTNPADCPYYDVSPEIGITSTPAIDPVAGIIYVVSRTKNTSNSTYHDYLHALSLTTGAEELGGPVELVGQVYGTGTGSSGGIVAFQPVYQLQRPALLLENGALYIAFGSVGDIGGVYHGWVMSYNASTLQQEAIFNVTPNGNEGGIWNSGQGPVADGSGNIYFLTANGDFNANVQGGTDYGDSFIKFNGPGLSVTDYFTPDTQAALAANNEDLGSGGPMLMPGTSLILGMGKDGTMRVVNTTNMGHYNPAIDNDVQDFAATPNAFFSSPIYWNSPNHGPLIYIWGGGDYLKAFQFNGSTFNTTPVSEGTILNSSGDPNAAAMSISADGSLVGTGILWATGSISQWAKGTQVPGYLRAFDATNLTTELWDSTQSLARDDVGNSAKYNPPTIANGKVYIGSFSGQLQVYGLNPPAFQGIRFVQVASNTPQSTVSSLSAAYSSAQTAGDLNLVIVGWNDTSAAVQSVTDSAGNTYTLAFGPTKGTGLSESIYYAKNILASGSNTVTVTFNQGATKPDVRILEYSGVATSNPLDVSTGASGSTYIADSGYVNTNAANELIVGASMVQGTTTVMAGAPFTPRVITSPNSDLAADRLVNVPGSYHSWEPLNASGNWVMQVVTFKSATASTIPFVSSVTPNSGAISGGTAVTISGIDFAAGDTVTFGSAAATNVVVVNSTTITATAPAGSAGPATVTVTNSGGQSGSLVSGFTYVAPPTVTGVSPSSGSTSGGTSVTVTGTNFASGSTVTFGSNAATNVTVVNSTTITATSPAGSTGAVTVTVTNSLGQSGSLASGYTYIVQPTVTSVSPGTGVAAGGTAVTITGTNFASGATVTLGSNAATNVTVVNNTTITATTPAGTAGAVTVTVTVGGQSGSLASGFTYAGLPTVTVVSPNNGPVAGGTSVTITGTNFAPGATVTFGSNAATGVTVVNSTSITATTPAAASAGAVTVTVTNIGSQSGSLAGGFTYNVAAAISFAQVASATPQSSTATVSVTYPAAQTVGDLNVVVVGWNDTTSTISTVKDSVGNTYKLAVGPTVGTGMQQSIYYAANITGGTNTVTVTFNQAVAYPDVRILEYKGVTTLDVKAGASGSGASANSSTATTTSPNELIFGADYVATTTTAAGSGFTSRIITSPDGDIAEDKTVTTAGSNSATATVSGSGAWVMQMVTFSAVSIPAPTVTGVSPSTGSTGGGTAVTITGTNFASGATVTFGTAAATNVIVVNSTTITATAPAGTAGAVTVTVTNSSGQSGSLASGFTYAAPPTLTSVSPGSGPAAGGTPVTITGTNFASGATVMFGSTAATNVTVVNSTSITATTPAGTLGAVAVTVTNSNGLSGSLASGFTYAPAPTVTSVNPNTGPTTGGTAITITGTNFAAGAVVTMVETRRQATNVVVVNSTTITAVTPTGDAGAATVSVTVNGQSGTLANGFTYIVQPTVTSVSPNSGSTSGGTSVTITGTNFASGATVSFGSNAATNVTVVNGTTITATTPAGTAGAVTVTVTAGGQSGSLASGFTYVGQPTVTGVSPSSGSTSGGTSVTITGTNFASGSTVTFGSNAATNVTVVNSTTITATTPAASAGAVTVTVTNSLGQSGSLANGYTYVVQPTVTAVSPNSGSTSGGTSVTITGTNFASGATVTLGSNSATNVTVVNSTTITATTPAGSAGAVTVTVTLSGQSGSLASGFTYVAPPTVTAVSPSSGPTSGGASVTITGTNFASGATVSFGGNAATNVTVVNGTTITATTPAGTAGAVTVTVTNVGSLSGSSANGYTYTVQPTVTSVSPTSGVTSGGTSVTITGTNFASGATVKFGSNSATNVAVVNGTTITATTPAGTAGAVTVTVTVGAQSGSLANGFTYIGQPTVTAVSPNNGPVAGGTSVTITGTNFASGATVTFGTAAATNVTIVSSTTITATTPAGSAGAVSVTVTNVGNQSGSLANGFTYNAAVAISFAQVASATPQSSTATVSVAYPAAQTAGDLNVVVVGWNNTTSTISTVKDSVGNTYKLAIGPTTGTGIRQSIYYAANIAGGSNTVTVTFSQAAAFPDIRILEYRGVTAVDVTAGASGSSTSANSGTATTTSANELIFGADYVSTRTKAAGSGFTSRIITSPDGDIAEDKIVTTAGSNSATATLSASGAWVMQMVTFSAVSGPAPTVTGVSPSSGSTGGGTSVTISGTNFASGATVSFGSVAATNVTVVNSTTITATTPAGTAGAVTVTVTNSGGPSGSLASGFTYVAAPSVSSVSPNSGPVAGGTPVTITGTNFANGATVTFGSTGATNVTVVNSTTITATTPAASVGAVTVTVTVGGQSGGLTSGFTYVGQPTVTAVSPSTGSTSGGSSVTITGTNFAPGATVNFASNAATNVTVVNSTTITATTPAGTTGAVTVTVTNVGSQSGSLANGFTYTVQPTVTTVSPNSGSTSGGTAVTITGTNFASGATVNFGSNAATNVSVVNGTTITATTPAGSAGAANVTVTVAGQSGSLASGFTYVAPPTVTSVSPSSGSTSGGTSVTIIGTNFASGATVSFGSNAATNVSVVNGTTITATTPAGTAGAVTVTVTVGGQSGSVANGFTYTVQPTVTAVSPNSGSTSGGTAVTITGTNFASGATVSFGSNAATNVTVVNGTTITATTPAGGAGSVIVTVTNSGGQSGSLINGFTFVAPPAVTSVSPNSGATGGGTSVTITGTNFASGSTVTFGSAAATNVVVVNSTTITATTPAGSAGAVTVTVTNSLGQTGSLASGFTYVVQPTVTSVSPSSGVAAGGTSVTITGTNFATGATVTFGSNAATNVVVVNSTTITATTPAGSAGAVTVRVTVGGQSGSLASGFTYIGQPTVTAVSPNNGPVAGGTTVTITGTNFATGATVTFGSNAATNVTVVNNTTITATTPAGSAGAVTVTVTNIGSQSGSLAGGFTYNSSVAISFAQVASATPQSSTATVSVSYPAAQTAGNLNVVVVGWNDTTSAVSSVKDSAGNTYQLAIGPTTGTGLLQSIYYAANITGGSNTVTVTFNQAASFPDVRILEYRGVTAVDVTAGANGSSTSANSGSATTTSANELIFGADLVATTTAAAGSGFTSRIVTPMDGDIAEDKIVTTAGSNNATATLSGSGSWLMQMVGFVPVPGPGPTVTSVSPNSGPTTGGTSVTITGANFRSGGTVTFGTAPATNVTVVNGTTITATTPAGSAGAATVTVTDPDGQSGSLAGGFTFAPVPSVSSVSPNNGPVAGGTSVTISGTNFVTGATVTFGSSAATNVTLVNSTTITATTPAGNAGAATVTVTNQGGQSGSLQGAFVYGSPTVSSLSPNSGSTTGGTEVIITGTNFASGATVSFGGAAATNVVVANITTVTATTPAGSAGAVTVTVTNPGGQGGSLASGFTYVVPPPTYSDNFNRANGSLGSNWTTPSSTSPATFPLQIVGNEVFAANTPIVHALEYYNAGLFANNQWASETVVNAPTNGASTQAILLRSNNTNYYNDGIPFGSSYFVGPANQVDFCAVGHVGAYANGDSHALYVAGSGPVFFWSFRNGVVDATCGDTANNITGGNPGIGMAADQNATPTMAAGNWQGGSLDSFSSTASDNFFRANAGWLGVNWWFTPIDPSAGLVNAFYTLTNNAAVLSSTGGSQYGVAIWTTALTGNQSVVTIGAYGSSADFVGPVVRYSIPNGNSVGSTTAFYFAEANSSGQVELFEYSGGTTHLLSNLGTYGGTVSTLELDASGTSPVTLTVKVNGLAFGAAYNDSTYKLTGIYDGFTTFGTSSTTVTSWLGN